MSEITARPILLQELEDRVIDLLELIAESKRPCKACGISLFFVRHRNGKLAPYTSDAVNHFINCPNAAEFRRAASAKAKAPSHA